MQPSHGSRYARVPVFAMNVRILCFPEDFEAFGNSCRSEDSTWGHMAGASLQPSEVAPPRHAPHSASPCESFTRWRGKRVHSTLPKRGNCQSSLSIWLASEMRNDYNRPIVSLGEQHARYFSSTQCNLSLGADRLLVLYRLQLPRA